jgi:hypothetical protein
MAIDRGPWNALVDDDGSNLIGTIWNKTAIKNVLLDPIDAMAANHVAFPYTTATLDNLDCGAASPVTVLSYYGASPITLTGVSFTTAPRGGDVLHIRTMALGGDVLLPHLGVSSHKWLNWVTSAPTPLMGGYGRATYIYNTGNQWVLHSHEQGDARPVVFNAANYTGQGAVTAGMVKQHHTYLKGRLCTGTVAIEGIPANSASAQFVVAGFPYQPVGNAFLVGLGSFTGPWGPIMGNPGQTVGAVVFNRTDFANFAANAHYVWWQATWPVT